MKKLLQHISITILLIFALPAAGQIVQAPSFALTGSQPESVLSGTSITLFGAAFDADATHNTVTFTPVGGGTGTDATLTGIVGTTRLDVTVPAGLAGGLYEVSVTRSSDGSVVTMPDLFTVITGTSPIDLPGAGAGLIGMSTENEDWGDNDGDGDLDLIITGESGSLVFSTKIYKNDGSGSFTAIERAFSALTPLRATSPNGM